MKSRSVSSWETITGSLSRPSKMPGAGYGLPALTSCNMGAKYAKLRGSVCSECYACKGHYSLPTVIDAQTKRLNAIAHPLWVDGMVALIGRLKEKHFRWHDSGDLISLEHLHKICLIAQLLPNYIFWLPTQEMKLVNRYRATQQIPSNLIIRISTPMIDGRIPKTDLCTSSVHKNFPAQGFECKASQNNNKCGDCRACWDSKVKNVSYPHH